MARIRPNAALIGRLRAVGLRPTRHRLALARLLFEDGDRHVAAEQLHRQATDAGIKMSLATVYNTLNRFTEVGLLQEVVIERSQSYFDTNTSHHHHFYCEEDRSLVDIPSERVKVAKLPPAPAGTMVTRTDIVIRVRNHA
jgi:Fur family iron response transcriptional regulator